MKTKVYFDNSSLGKLYRKRQNLDLNSLFKNCVIYLSALNIAELVVYNNIKVRNELLKFYNKINYQNIEHLEDPLQLLKNTYLAYRSRKVYVKASNKKFLSFLNEPYEITKEDVESMEKYLTLIRDRIISANKKVRNDPRIKNINKRKQGPKCLSEFLKIMLKNRSIINEFIEKILISIGINDFKKKDGIVLFRETEPWLFYLSAFLGGIYNWGIKKEENPHPDFNDVSQAIYLFACDYFITDDKALKSLLTEVITFIRSHLHVELNKKVLKFDEFLTEFAI